jgi:3-hydroxymyristoyl/3-hydroxydecanoyl-(acyl carrier protein) dehydratase
MAPLPRHLERPRRQPYAVCSSERVRDRRPVHSGDVVEIEARVLRLRGRMGLLTGAARVDGKVAKDGTMTADANPLLLA